MMKTIMSGDIKPKEPERMAPTFSLTEDDLPEIKDWKVGGKYTITLQVEQVSSSKDSTLGSKKLDARFKVLSASVGDEAETPEEEAEPEEEDDYAEGEGEDMGDMGGHEKMMKEMMGKQPKGPHIAIIVRAAKKKLGVA